MSSWPPPPEDPDPPPSSPPPPPPVQDPPGPPPGPPPQPPQYGQYQQQYQQYPQYPPYPAPGYRSSSYNGMAIASMVLGIVWLCWIGSILALVFGYLAKRQIRETGQQGSGFATAGIVLGWIGVGILALNIVVIIIDAATGGFDSGAGLVSLRR